MTRQDLPNGVSVLENEQLVVYQTENRDFQPDWSENKPELVITLGRNARPYETLRDVIDGIRPEYALWIDLPKKFPVLAESGLQRFELDGVFRDSFDDVFGMGAEELLVVHSHFQPIPNLHLGVEHMLTMYEKDRLPIVAGPYRTPWQVSARNIPKGSDKEQKMYGILECFCEHRLGPSLRSRKTLSPDQRSELFACTSEDEARRVLQKAHEDPNDEGLWIGLNQLFPNLQERLRRVKEFEENWFPGELLKVKEEAEKATRWLSELLRTSHS